VTCPSGNPIPLLRSGESETCAASRQVTVGQYSNIGSATGGGPLGALYSDSDPSHHFGREAPAIPTLSSTARAILILVLSALGAYFFSRHRRVATDQR
jgi:hypothetical protein